MTYSYLPNMLLIAVPVTYAWRNELEIKAHQAISRAMGQPPPSRGGVMSRGGSRMQQQQRGTQFGHLQDAQVRTYIQLSSVYLTQCSCWNSNCCDCPWVLYFATTK